VAERPDAMAMTALESDLRALAPAIAHPAVAPDFAARVVARLEEEPRPTGSWWRRLVGVSTGQERPTRGRPLRRALVLAVILLLVIAAIATALALGVPGIRIFFSSTSSASPAASASAPSQSRSPAANVPLGASLGLGTLTPLDAVEAAVGFKPRLPAGVGQPAAAYVRDRRLMMVWPQSNQLPQIFAPGIGLIVTEFDGRVDPGYYSKVANSGTVVEAVRVSGQRGYWLTGEAHQLWYLDENGNQIDEPPRLVGRALIWADDALTYRLETSLSRDETIRLAESMQ
jgi:hypothetical protein